jgi:hypothetical protein
LHAGLVVIIPNVPAGRQRELFQAALSHIGERDLTNAVLEVDLVASAITCREYLYPGPEQPGTTPSRRRQVDSSR